MLKIIDNKIRKKLVDHNMTIKDLCYKIGMSENGYAKMMKNESAKLSTLEKIAKVLDVPMQFFFDGEYNLNDSSINIATEGKASYKQDNSSMKINNKQNHGTVNNNFEENKYKSSTSQDDINKLLIATYERIKEKEEYIESQKIIISVKDELIVNLKAEIERLKGE